MSYGRMYETEKRLREEVRKLLSQAEATDKEEDKRYGGDRRGDELPEELQRRETRIAQALEERAREQAESEGKDTEKAQPTARSQSNFTDPESRILKAADGFVQGYNTQIGVESAFQWIVGQRITQAANDKQQLVPLVEKIEEQSGQKPQGVVADSGYCSEENFKYLNMWRIEGFAATEKEAHGQRREPCKPGLLPTEASRVEQMARKLQTQVGAAIYATRKSIVEPVFGQIKHGRGLRQFLLRGLKVRGKWALIWQSAKPNGGPMSVKRPELGLWIPLYFVCLIAGCFSPQQVPSGEVRPVKTIVVAAADRRLVRSFPGIVQASKMADLGFQVSGVLVSLPFREGERVSKGKVIAQLRNDEFQARVQTMQASLEQARAGLRAAESRLTNSKTESERFGRLVESTAVSRSDYDSAQAAYRAAQEDYTAQQAAIRGIEGQLAEAKLLLGDSSLRAPYDGVVAQRLAEVGQNIFPNNPVIRFQNVNDIDIVVDVPEGFVGSDLRASSTQKSVAELSTVPSRQFPVRLKEITQIADPRTQVFQVRFSMKAPAGVTALPGMTANVTITTRGNRGLENRVPISAVSTLSTGEQVVWLLGAEQTVHHRMVTLGAPTGDQIEILSGLQSGDRIVVAGTTFLHEGMKVRDLGDALGGGQW